MKAAVFCKSFRDDFARLPRLIGSWREHARDFPLLLSVPAGDRELLPEAAGGEGITVVEDEAYAPEIPAGMDGWRQQQVCKLAIHHTGFADAYVMIDSDSYFVGPLDEGDVFAGEKRRIVYSKCFSVFEAPPAENENLLSLLQAEGRPAVGDERYFGLAAGRLDGFAERLAGYRARAEQAEASGPDVPGFTAVDRSAWLFDLFMIPNNAILQPGQILQAPFLAGFEEFMADQGMGLADVIKLIPWEYNWYAAYSMSAHAEMIVPNIALILHFASDAAVEAAKAAGVSAEMIGRRFPIVQMAARHFEREEF